MDIKNTPQEKTIINSVEDMTLYALSRYAALLEAIDIIDDNCHKNKKNFKDIELKPLTLRKYVESTSDIHFRNLKEKVFGDFT